MEPDDITQHCFRCKGLMVVDPSTIKALPGLLYRAANQIDNANYESGYLDPTGLAIDLRAIAVLLDMIPDD